MPEQKMKITEEAFSDFTRHMCRAGFTNSVSNEPLSERQQNHLAACFRTVPFTQSVSVESVALTPDSVSVEKGKSVKLRVDVQPSNATNKRVTWTSKNSDKTTVDQNGNVAGVAVGTATIEVVSQDGSHKATATVEVTEPVVAVTGVSVDPSTTSVEANKTVQLTANIEPAGATNKRVTWASKNAEFATVDSATGLVTGVAAGTATIEVTTEDGSHKATATVEVTAAPAA